MTDPGSYLELPATTGFGLDNLPYGIGSVRRPDGSATAGSVFVAVGDDALDLAAAQRAGVFEAIDGLAGDEFAQPSLNRFMATGPRTWQAVRERIRGILVDRSFEARVRGWLTPRADLTMHLPVAIGDYVDFYSSEHHATNLGRILRPGSPPLLPNWRYLPVGYHGRAGTVVVSGTDVVRPHGLVTTDDGPPRYEPTRMLDIELEVGTIVGVGSDLGRPIPIDRAADHLFGMVLLNDWSGPRHPGLRVPTARAAPRQELRHVDLAVGRAVRRAATVPRPRTGAGPRACRLLDDRGAMGRRSPTPGGDVDRGDARRRPACGRPVGGRLLDHVLDRGAAVGPSHGQRGEHAEPATCSGLAPCRARRRGVRAA